MPRFNELSAVPTAMPLTGEPQSAMTPRQADFPQSQRRAVPSLEQERTFLPRSTMAVSKIPASKQRPCSDRQRGRQIAKASQGKLNYKPQAPVPRLPPVTHSQLCGVQRGAGSHSIYKEVYVEGSSSQQATQSRSHHLAQRQDITNKMIDNTSSQTELILQLQLSLYLQN